MRSSFWKGLTFEYGGLARVLCGGGGGGGAELSVAGPGSDRSLVGRAASCGATLPETLDGPGLDSASAGHGALTVRERVGREEKGV